MCRAPGQFFGDVGRGLACMGGDGRDLGLGSEGGLRLGVPWPVVISATSPILSEVDFLWRPEVLDLSRRTARKYCSHGRRGVLIAASVSWRKSDARATAFRLSLATLDQETRGGRSQATASALGDAEEWRCVSTEGKAFVGGESSRNGDRSNPGDVIHGIGKSNGRWTENGRERRLAREGDTLSPLCASK